MGKFGGQLWSRFDGHQWILMGSFRVHKAALGETKGINGQQSNALIGTAAAVNTWLLALGRQQPVCSGHASESDPLDTIHGTALLTQEDVAKQPVGNDGEGLQTCAMLWLFQASNLYDLELENCMT